MGLGRPPHPLTPTGDVHKGIKGLKGREDTDGTLGSIIDRWIWNIVKEGRRGVNILKAKQLES